MERLVTETVVSLSVSPLCPFIELQMSAGIIVTWNKDYFPVSLATRCSNLSPGQKDSSKDCMQI